MTGSTEVTQPLIGEGSDSLAPFAPGDIFLPACALDPEARFPTGETAILQLDADWQPKARLETGNRGLISSVVLAPDGKLYALDPQARSITVVGGDGKLVTDAFSNLASRGYGSMIALSDGTYLLGEHMLGQIPGFAGRGKVYHVAADGAGLAEYDTQANGGMGGFLGVTHMALSADGSVLYHSTETGNQVYAHDLANDRRLGPVYTRNDPPGLVFGIALKSDGSGLLVACGNEVRLIGLDGVEQRRFTIPDARGVAVPIIRGDHEFWALDFYTGVLTAFDLTGGQIMAQHSTGLAKCLTSMASI